MRTQLLQADDLPFADVLTAERLETALREEQATWREALFAAVLTLWAFLSLTRAKLCKVKHSDLAGRRRKGD